MKGWQKDVLQLIACTNILNFLKNVINKPLHAYCTRTLNPSVYSNSIDLTTPVTLQETFKPISTIVIISLLFNVKV